MPCHALLRLAIVAGLVEALGSIAARADEGATADQPPSPRVEQRAGGGAAVRKQAAPNEHDVRPVPPAAADANAKARDPRATHASTPPARRDLADIARPRGKAEVGERRAERDDLRRELRDARVNRRDIAAAARDAREERRELQQDRHEALRDRRARR